jgi:hypothetical protein
VSTGPPALVCVCLSLLHMYPALGIRLDRQPHTHMHTHTYARAFLFPADLPRPLSTNHILTQLTIFPNSPPPKKKKTSPFLH